MTSVSPYKSFRTLDQNDGLASLSKLVLWFSTASPATPINLIQQHNVMRSPTFAASALWTSRWLAQLHHQLDHERLAHVLDLLFGKLACALLIHFDNCERSFSLKFCARPCGGIDRSVRILSFSPHYHMWTCLSSWPQTLYDRRYRQMTRRGRSASVGTWTTNQ